MSRPIASDLKRAQRSNQLLDAALSLWMEHPQRVASVAEVAQRAGVAKGTIYLYFKSKEDLLLAAHERNVGIFFAALMARARQAEVVTFEEVMGLFNEYFVAKPVSLPLATLVGGLMHKGITPSAAEAFELRLAACLREAGGLLCRHFKLADELTGVRLLMRSYALTIGLWQMLGSEQRICVGNELTSMLLPEYPLELHAALHALWKGTLNES